MLINKIAILFFLLIYYPVHAEGLSQDVSGENNNLINNNSGTITNIYINKGEILEIKNDSASITRIAMGETGDFIRYQVVMNNLRKIPLFAEKLTLVWDMGDMRCLCHSLTGGGCSYNYTISDKAFMKIKNNHKEGTSLILSEVSANDGAFDGFKLKLSGFESGGCGWNGTQFSFETSVILEPNSFTAIYVDIPKKIVPYLNQKNVNIYARVSTNMGEVSSEKMDKRSAHIAHILEIINKAKKNNDKSGD